MILDIAMPFYGRFDHFREAVESVLAQTSDDWRLTVLDDVNPDPAPGDWARSIEDPRVRYIRNPENLRPSRNYNKAVELSTAEHMVIMGCDDMLLPGYVARVKTLLAEFPDADVLQPGVEVIDDRGDAHDPLPDRVKSLYRPSGRGPRVLSGDPLARSLLRGNWTYFPSLVWRRRLLADRGFRTDLDVVQDLAMLLEITFDGGTVVVDDERVFRYRRHAGSFSSLTGVDGSKFAQERVVFGEAARESRRRGWTGARRAARAHLSSRLNAASELPSAILSRDPTAVRALARHVVGGLDEAGRPRAAG